MHATKDQVCTQLIWFFLLLFFLLGDITFQQNYAFLIVLEDLHIPVFMTSFFQYLPSINKDNHRDSVVTIKSVFLIRVSPTAFYTLMFKSLTFTNLYNFNEISRSMLVMKSPVSTLFFNFDQASVYLKPIAFMSSTFNESANSIVKTCCFLAILVRLKIPLKTLDMSDQVFSLESFFISPNVSGKCLPQSIWKGLNEA